MAMRFVGPATAKVPGYTYTQLLAVPFVAPSAGTAVVQYIGSCCVDTLETSAKCLTDPVTWLWVGIDTAVGMPADHMTFEVPNVVGTTSHLCFPVATSRSFAVAAGANKLFVTGKTNAGAQCSGSATVLFTVSQMAAE
jgi:hypothetical protein